MSGVTLGLVALSLAATGPQTDIDQLLDNTDGFSGVLLTHNGAALSSRHARGFADAARELPHDVTLDWRWASVTKQIVTVLALQLVETGAVTLDTPLSEAAPQFDVDGADQITVRDLMRHTTGLADPDDIAPEQFNPSAFDPVEFCTGGRAVPGAAFNYNNCDFVALAAVIEAVGGAPWVDQLAERILDPAGMTQTRVGTQSDAGAVTGYDASGEPSGAAFLELFGAAGALVGPPEDLIAFNAALMDGRLLGPSALEALWNGDPRLGYVALGAWSFPAGLSGCDAPVALVERRGFIAGVQVRNILAPQLGRSLVILVNRADFEFGEIWMGSGFSHAVASAAFCDGQDD